ncbi:hypothetical protein HZF05_08260 [Sphingomonas sp. CGMCC 1.13654]|uniref:Uncharacterized protein n=1 Tax=Sphingomonas chungangi TaxID=2683589 RepID=A0A838L638_9SPHN|nr:hypothetical protein [Sphingomonas chungangi]MBA2934092.1 hypothetical protein [Sphingomonas chungangi]MVW57133.1 hypothetical protein [Sphingomonas chungangi]
MAYVDTRPHELVWSPRFAVRLPIAARPLLQRVERDVLLASRHDRVSSLEGRTPLRRWICRLFGFEVANRLADPRLEALRRFVVLFRRRGERLPAAEQARLVAAGFLPLQIAEVRRLVEAERAPRKARWKRRYLALVALAFALEAVIFRLASAYFSDGLVGFAFALTTAVAGSPLIGFLRRGPTPAPR